MGIDRRADQNSESVFSKQNGLGRGRIPVIAGITILSIFLGLALFGGAGAKSQAVSAENILEARELLFGPESPAPVLRKAYAGVLVAISFPRQAQARLEQLRQSKREFYQKLDAWHSADLPNEIKSILSPTSQKSVEEFWEVSEEKIFPALVEESISTLTLPDLMSDYVPRIDATMDSFEKSMGDAAVSLDLQAQSLISNHTGGLTYSWISLVVWAAPLLFVLGILNLTWWMTNKKRLNALKRHLDRMGKTQSLKSVPFLHTGNEFGDVARAIAEVEIRHSELESEWAKSRALLEGEIKDLKLRSIDENRQILSRQQSIGTLVKALREFSNGDLDARITNSLSNELEPLRLELNHGLCVVAEMRRNMHACSIRLAGEVRKIAQISESLSQQSYEQSKSIVQCVEELSAVSKSIETAACTTGTAQGLIEMTNSEASNSSMVVADALTAIGQFEASSKQIDNIVVVIEDIAFQTNLLALNAGVEAARAGESGAGFAVVASEVRALAQRSKSAAREIKTLLSKSSAQINEGGKRVQFVQANLETVSERVFEVGASVTQLADMTAGHGESLARISTSFSQLKSGTAVSQGLLLQAEESCRAASGEASAIFEMSQSRAQVLQATEQVALVAQHNPPSRISATRKRDTFEPVKMAS
ncbi:MAG: hypothetical protein HRU27_17470 [Rhizobiaceae bacterium]|nr:hypothetical protein [Rhizobiaceae bacterium]